MKRNLPKVSIIMPVYNAEKYIVEAIDSVLAQTFRDFELIIINDSSTDKTPGILASYAKKDPRIRVIRHRSKRNIARVLNIGIKVARGAVIARMDADDIALPDRIRLQYNRIISSETIAAVGADIIIIDKNGRPVAIRTYPTTSKELKRCLFKYSSFAHPIVMFKKHIFEKVGGYDSQYSPTEDLDLWFRLGNGYEFASIPQPLLKYRLFNASSSHKVFKRLELLVFAIRWKAVTKYGYRPTIPDMIYNIVQFLTLWFTPANVRIKVYNFLRNNKYI